MSPWDAGHCKFSRLLVVFRVDGKEFVLPASQSDQHIVSRNLVYDSTGNAIAVRNEGFFRAHIGSGRRYRDQKIASSNRMQGRFSFYDVPFGVMVPANPRQASNLLVPVCISASSVAYSSARIENMFMDLGSAAGVAVAGLLDLESPRRKGSCPPLKVQNVNVTSVQEKLANDYNQSFHGEAADFVATPK